MKTLFAILTAVVISGLGFAASAQEKIEGAFGKKLGEIFDPTTAISTNKLKDGEIGYEFATTNGFRAFKSYYVKITPTTHTIFCVYGVGIVESTSAGRKEQSVLMGRLREKYGSEFKIGPIDSMGDVKRISQGSRHIITTLNGYPEINIDIKYFDDELEKLAEKERVASEAEKADRSGL